MKRIVLGLFLLLSTTPAFANCVTVEDARAQIATVQGAKVIELSGAELKTAGEIFNALTGTDLPVDTAALVELPDGSGALAIGPDGLICGAVRYTPDGFKALRRSIVGLGA